MIEIAKSLKIIVKIRWRKSRRQQHLVNSIDIGLENYLNCITESTFYYLITGTIFYSAQLEISKQTHRNRIREFHSTENHLIAIRDC